MNAVRCADVGGAGAAVQRQIGKPLLSSQQFLRSEDWVALLALSELANRADEAVAGRSGKDALVALARVHRSFAQEHPGLFQAARHPINSSTAATSGGARLSRILHATLRGYELTDADRVHAIRLLGSFFLGFPLLELSGSFAHSAPEANVSWERSLDGLDALLKSWSVA